MKLNRRQIIIFSGIAVITIVVLFLIFRNKSNYTWPVASGSVTVNERTLKSAMQNCLSSYQVSWLGFKDLLTTDPSSYHASNLTANTNMTTCMTSNVSIYITNRCSYDDNGVTRTLIDGSAPPTTNGGLTTKYNQYKQELIDIEKAYVYAIDMSGDTSFPTSWPLQSRRADMLNATRKYFAYVCPGLYQTSGSNPEAIYRTWSVTESPEASVKSFQPSQVTISSIKTWALYATSNGDGITPIASPANNVVSKYNLTASNGKKNWEIAKVQGAGTVNGDAFAT
jgi:hypothetical protein